MKPNEKGWWSTATVDEKLAQIDGGIECGMTAKQVAMNCGAGIYYGRNTVLAVFAASHGRSFPASNAHSGNQTKRAREGVRIRSAKNKAKNKHELTDHHFNIFSLGDATKAPVDFKELEF